MTIATKKRFFIIGTGRTGSSLLSAILHDSDASFGMDSVKDWNAKYGGAYEHPDIKLAHNWYSRCNKISDSLIPNAFILPYCKNRLNNILLNLLNNVEYVKQSNLIWLIQSIYNMGFQPVVIISYRNFEDFARSRYLRFG